MKSGSELRGSAVPAPSSRLCRAVHVHLTMYLRDSFNTVRDVIHLCFIDFNWKRGALHLPMSRSWFSVADSKAWRPSCSIKPHQWTICCDAFAMLDALSAETLQSASAQHQNPACFTCYIHPQLQSTPSFLRWASTPQSFYPLAQAISLHQPSLHTASPQ